MSPLLGIFLVPPPPPLSTACLFGEAVWGCWVCGRACFPL